MNKRHKIFFWTTIVSIAISMQVASAGNVYVYKDKDGHVTLTDRPPHDGFRLVTSRDWLHKEMSSIDTKNFKKNREHFSNLIGKAARRYRVDEALLDAIVTAESAYDPRAVSKAGAVGLMQLMPGTASRYGVHDRYNPQANVYAGTKYFRDLLKQFEDLQLALAAYNAGENNVVRYGNRIPPFKETQKYVKKVMHYYKKYRAAM
ncbi:MAG: lytic transglycosylase domain-containing protein [Gammaproteobacteria bacterium]|nr:MAG: lytic transglycosylase domain-containing protein [Gammaproteobacteria bacterium]